MKMNDFEIFFTRTFEKLYFENKVIKKAKLLQVLPIESAQKLNKIFCDYDVDEHTNFKNFFSGKKLLLIFQKYDSSVKLIPHLFTVLVEHNKRNYETYAIRGTGKIFKILTWEG